MQKFPLSLLSIIHIKVKQFNNWTNWQWAAHMKRRKRYTTMTRVLNYLRITIDYDSYGILCGLIWTRYQKQTICFIPKREGSWHIGRQLCEAVASTLVQVCHLEQAVACLRVWESRWRHPEKRKTQGEKKTWYTYSKITFWKGYLRFLWCRESYYSYIVTMVNAWSFMHYWPSTVIPHELL